jgi:hypothetical protein
MITFQFILFICTTLPQAVEKLYITITINGLPDDDDVQDFHDELFIHTAQMISFINHSRQFYIFTLSSKLFRQELKKVFQELRIFRRQPTGMAVTMHKNQIHFQMKREIQ